MELSKTLERIRSLIAKAEAQEAAGTPEALNEANALRAKADELMQRYAVKEWQLLKEAPQSTKPQRIRVDIGEADSPFLSEAATLVNVVARFCKCSSIWVISSGWKGRNDEYCYVYGYESDLRYFELLFTALYLHMSGTIFPKPDLTKTVGENAYELHNAGLNWFDIAQAYGWEATDSRPGEARYMYRHRETGERASWGKTVGRIKSAYTAEVKRRGEEALRIPPSGADTFRRNAAQGYLHRINQRLQMIAGKRGSGAEVVLADKSQNIAAMMSENHPDSRPTARRNVRYNADAYRRGVDLADTASLNPEAAAPKRDAIS